MNILNINRRAAAAIIQAGGLLVKDKDGSTFIVHAGVIFYVQDYDYPQE